jgi:hypothetical protein
MDFRQRLEQARMHLVGETPPSVPEEHFTTPYFAGNRGNSPACLELRLQDGSRKAFPYAYITAINFEADAGIEVLTSQKSITITGRNLTSLYECLVTYRVRYVQADMGTDTQEDGLFVAQILIEEL